MTKKWILLALIPVLIVAIVLVLWKGQNKALSTPISLETSQKIEPSKTLKQYQDPSGFAFSYPDNLSLTKNDSTDSATYADIQLSANRVNGSLSLKIADSKFLSINEWLKLNQAASKTAPTEVSWGNLKAKQLTTDDRLLLGALDQGILFTIEVPLVDKDFWMNVYDQVVKSFAFAPPEANTTLSGQAGSTDVSFEGEEAIE